ncbi:MAG TPA: hypothetical protein VF258_10565 [Luteolibacter sp.]
MRTTLDLPDPLFREIKTRAVQQGVTLKDLLAQYIQAGMNAPAAAAPPIPRPHIPLPYFRKTEGPVIPARSNAELYAALDEEDIANYHRVMTQSQPKP